MVVGGHEGFDYREPRAAAAAVRGGARLIATGRDAIFPMPDGPWPATGAILAAIETAGGMPAVVVGKPERIMFDIAREALAGCTRIGVIGDHLTSDIEGAKRAGLDAILVLTGATSQADLERAPIPPDLVLDSLAALPRSNRGHVMTGHPARRAELLTPAGAARSTWTTTPPHRWTPA